MGPTLFGNRNMQQFCTNYDKACYPIESWEEGDRLSPIHFSGGLPTHQTLLKNTVCTKKILALFLNS